MTHSTLHGTNAVGGMSGNSTNASSAGSSGRSSRTGSRLLRRPASEAAAAAGAGPLGVELAAAADEAQDAARIAAAAHVDYPEEERAMLAQAAAIACDQLEITRAGPSFVQSGLSPFGTLLAVWREPSVAAGAVGAGRAGVDVWAGVTAHGYIVLWTQDGSNTSSAAPATPSGTSAVETRLVDFEKFLSDSYRSLTAATFTMPKLLPGAGGKRGTLTFFVLTEEGHGLTFAVDLGVLLTAAPAESEEEDGKNGASANGAVSASSAPSAAAGPVAATGPAAAASEGSRRVGIVGHRRLLLRKALYPRDLPAGSGFASVSHAALASSTRHTLAFHALTNSILLSVDSELYAYSDANLHTLWQASVGPAILGGAGSAGATAAAHGAASSSTPEEKKAASVAAAAAVASSAQRMDAKQRRTHAITSLAFPSVLSLDTPSLLVGMNALAAAAGAAPFTLPQSQSSFHGQPPPPPFLVAGTKSGYLLRIELRRRDLGGSAVGAVAAGATGRVVPDVRVLARFQEHTVSQPMGFPAEEDGHVTGEQRDELARKKEDERRKKAGGVAASAVAAASAAVSPTAGAAASPADDSASSSSATTPRAAFPLFKLGENGSSASGNSNAAAVAFDPTQFPPSPVLIGSPWFDPSPSGAASSFGGSNPSPIVRASAYGTSLTTLAVVLRRGEWLCVVGCADGFVHVVARDGARVYSDSNDPSQQASSQCKYASIPSAQSPPHPVVLDPAFPAALLFTLVDPCAHSTSARVSPVVRLVSSLDAGLIVALDAAGVVRRWDLNQRCLAGRTHTEGVLHAGDPRGSAQAGGAASAAAPASFSAHMELVYAGAHSELAVLYGPGGPLAGLGGAASPLVRMHSRGTQGGSSGSSGSGSGGLGSTDKEMTPAALLAAGLLLPSHVLIVCHTAFSVWRLQRMARVLQSHPFALSLDFPGSVLSAAPSVLSELGAFIAAYQAEECRITEAYGTTQGEKLRLELSQSQSQSQAQAHSRDGGADTKLSTMASREEMASPDSLIYTPSPNAPLSPSSAVAASGNGSASGGGAGGVDGLLRTSSTGALLKGHHSIAATPYHPGLVEATSPVLARSESASSAAAHAHLVPSFTLPPPQSEVSDGDVGGDLQSSSAIDSAVDFYGFAVPSAAATTAVSPPNDHSASSQPNRSPPVPHAGVADGARGAELIQMSEPRGPVEAKLSQLSIFSPHASASPSASASASPFPDSGGSGGSAQTIDADTPANLREASAQVLPAISVHVDADPDDE